VKGTLPYSSMLSLLWVRR